jgi:hypothetical protein
MSRYGGGPGATFGTVTAWDFTAEQSPDLVRDAHHPQATSGKYNAHDGLFFVHMITYQNYTEAVSTLVNAAAGQLYNATFAYAQGGLWVDSVNGWKYIGIADAAVRVTITDTVSSSIVYSGSFVAPTTTFNPANSPNTLDWLHGSFTFTGSGNPLRMLFSADRLTNDFVNLYLDDVAVDLAPHLNITNINGTQINITWTTNSIGYSLEAATNLVKTGWTSVTNPVGTTGDHFTLTVTADGLSRFFRLKKP